MRAEPEDRFAGSDLPEEARTRRGVLRILVAAVALIAFAAAVWYAYTLGARSGTLDVPVVTAEKGPWKERPENPGGLQVPNQDKAVFNRLEPAWAQPKEERLLPPPEEPMDRPPPPEAEISADVTAPPPSPSPTGTEAAEAVREIGPLAEGVTSIEPAADDAAKEPSEAAAEETAAENQPEPEAANVASLPPASPAPASETSGGGGFRVQLASLRSEAGARQTWQRLQSNNKDLLGGLGMTVERADLGEGKGVFYRVQAGPLEKALASLLCGKLKSRDVACLVVAR